MKILCAAIWYLDDIIYPHQPKNVPSGIVFCGHRHHNIFIQINYPSFTDSGFATVRQDKMIQGFLTQDNYFVDRSRAAEIALAAGQISEPKTELFSEDLY